MSFPGVNGTFVATVYIQGRQEPATPTLTLAAPGYVSGTIDVEVDPAGFASHDPVGTLMTTAYSPNTTIDLRPWRLDPTTMDAVENQELRGGASVSVQVDTDTPGVGAIVGSPAVFNAGDASKPIAFDPQSPGTAAVLVDVPAGFTAPGDRQLGFTVTQPIISVPSSLTVGRNLEVGVDVYLQEPPPSPVTVTVTSTDASTVAISTGKTVLAAGTASFPGVTTAFAGTIWIQGIEVGTGTLTVTAPGYVAGSITVPVGAAGFVTPYTSMFMYLSQGETPLYVEPALLDSDGNPVSYQTVRAGVSGTVPVTSYPPTVGHVVNSSAAFNGGDSVALTYFHAAGAGTSTITIGGTSGFRLPVEPARTITMAVYP